MKGKQYLNLVLIAMLIVSIVPLFAPSVSAYTADSVYIDPPTKSYVSDTYCTYSGTEFTLQLKVDNVQQLYGYDVAIDYNATLLELVSTSVTGTGQVVPTSTSQYSFLESNSPGKVRAAVGFFSTLGAPSFNGSGTLEWMTFKIIYCPTQKTSTTPPAPDNTVSCAIDILRDTVTTELYDPSTAIITVGSFDDGYYEYTTLGKIVGAPVAQFTWSPAVVYVGDYVSLLDQSTPNGGAITAWKWVVLGDATLTGSSVTKNTQMHCDGLGSAIVTLTVWDDEGFNSTITKPIEQKEKLGAFFDLYTSANRFCGQITTFVGAGPDEPCDALSPDVNVTLFAAAAWNGKPVMHVLVAFVVTDHNGDCVLYRTAETDKDGIARVWFRVPTPCTGQMFGKWLAYANCKIQEVKQEDTMPFDVGYAVTLLTVTTTDENFNPKSTFLAPCEYLGVTITAKNIMMIPKEVTFIFVAYDDCDVPIGQTIMEYTIDPGVFCTPNKDEIELTAIHLPQWTYVGVGKVYVSAFTTLPQQCGVAYCPELSTTFGIEWSGSTGP